MATPKYIAPAITFDGRKDYMARNLTGAADGKKGVLSLHIAGCESVGYFEPGEYLDLSDEAALSKFINKDGEPVNLTIPHDKAPEATKMSGKPEYGSEEIERLALVLFEKMESLEPTEEGAAGWEYLSEGDRLFYYACVREVIGAYNWKEIQRDV